MVDDKFLAKMNEVKIAAEFAQTHLDEHPEKIGSLVVPKDRPKTASGVAIGRM